MESPKTFISYSWTTPAHEEWVLNLATELRESGVDIVLDKWDLKEGHDANSFMEKMVTDEEVTKVIIVCDSGYASKADARKGGVGTETQIITAEIYEKVEQNKFVAVIAEKDKDNKACVPTFYKSRKYIDLSDGDLYAVNFEQLLRWIYDKPFYIKPELGKRPAFLDEDSETSLGTSVLFRRALDAIRTSKPYALGAVSEYFDVLSTNIEKMRLEPSKGKDNFDDDVIASIESFLPYRNESIEIFLAIGNYGKDVEYLDRVRLFFEQLIPYLFSPVKEGFFHEWAEDNFKYIIYELFLYCFAAALKTGNTVLAEKLTQQRYYVVRDEEYGREPMRNFGVFRCHLHSFDYRNDRLSLNRLSLRANIIKEHSPVAGIDFNNLMQADFALFLADSISAHNEQVRQNWYPDTLVYKTHQRGSFEIFRRSESTEYFEKIMGIWGLVDKKQLLPVLEAFEKNTLHVPKWGFDTISPAEIINYEKLCKRP